MRTSDLADLLGCAPTTVPRQARRCGIGDAIGRGEAAWSPGDALALLILRELEGQARYAEGARTVGEALDNGFRPAVLLTRGFDEFVVLLDEPDVEAHLAALLLQASETGTRVQVVHLRDLVARVEPYVRELAVA